MTPALKVIDRKLSNQIRIKVRKFNLKKFPNHKIANF